MRSSPQANSTALSYPDSGSFVGDLGEIRVVVERADRLRSSLRGFSGVAGCLEPERLLLQREAVYVGVLDRVGVDRRLEREARFAQAAHDRVVVSQVGRPGVPRLHQPDRPAVALERLARRDRPASHRRPPVVIDRGRLDLAEDDVDHAIEELILVRHVLVERHRHHAELLREPAHAEPFKPVLVCERHGSLEHERSAQACAAGVRLVRS